MAKVAKRKAPSRVRYEQAHPTVSCRVQREVYDKLKEVEGEADKSFADILKIGLGIIEARVEEEGEIRKKAYDQGYEKGRAEAERLYKVTYPCSVCGGMLTVDSVDEKRDIKKYMQENKWVHKECHEKEE